MEKLDMITRGSAGTSCKISRTGTMNEIDS
jgi:hypothetical protein